MTCAFCSDDASTLLTVSKGQNIIMICYTDQCVFISNNFYTELCVFISMIC